MYVITENLPDDGAQFGCTFELFGDRCNKPCHEAISEAALIRIKREFEARNFKITLMKALCPK